MESQAYGRMPSEVFIVLLPSTVSLIVLVVDVVSNLLLLLLLVMGTKGVVFFGILFAGLGLAGLAGRLECCR